MYDCLPSGKRQTKRQAALFAPLYIHVNIVCKKNNIKSNSVTIFVILCYKLFVVGMFERNKKKIIKTGVTCRIKKGVTQLI